MKELREAAYEDFEARLVYADWLEEQGEYDKARFWRNAARKKWMPIRNPNVSFGTHMWGHQRWTSRGYLEKSTFWIKSWQGEDKRMFLIPTPVWEHIEYKIAKNDQVVWTMSDSIEEAYSRLECAWIATHPKKEVKNGLDAAAEEVRV